MPVIPVNRVADPKRTTGRKWRAEEEERNKRAAESIEWSLPRIKFFFPRRKKNRRRSSRVARLFLLQSTKTGKIYKIAV
jgi:hypothetical protein